MTAIYHTYQHRCVRDLAWAIASPPLCCVLDRDVVWPNAEWYLTTWHGMQQWLVELDRDPASLLEYCQSFCAANKRLGRYFEALLAFWFEHDPRYELLYHDVQIQADGRTAGAFDFIVRDHGADMTVHIEAAIKFFLGTGAGEWPGPDRQDSMQRKLDHLVRVQSRLSMNPAVRPQLLDMGVDIEVRKVILKGRLFYPVTEYVQPPLQACTGHLKGQWLQQSDFLRHFSGFPLRWVCLEKADWLSAIMACDQKQGISTEQLRKHWNDRPLQWPCCLAALDAAGDETLRVFVVADGWADSA